MQILFYKEDMEKNIEFTKKLFEMDLEGKIIYFETFQENRWKRIPDKKMNLEKFVELMERCNFFVSKLFIGEDNYIPIRYAVNSKDSKNDKLLEINCDLTNNNYCKIHKLYLEIYDKFFPLH